MSQDATLKRTECSSIPSSHKKDVAHHSLVQACRTPICLQQIFVCVWWGIHSTVLTPLHILKALCEF